MKASSRRAIDWSTAIEPLIKLYRAKPHPLRYENSFQLIVMVTLSAQTSDDVVNAVAPELFRKYPSFAQLAAAKATDVHETISKVRNFANKTRWLQAAAEKLKDNLIPETLDELTSLPGIGRKSANVILHELGKTAQGIIVDLHVLRVAPRLGISSATDPQKMEKELMEKIPANQWGDIGMALSFLGRETCRPADPACPVCVMKTSCTYFRKGKK